MTPAPDPSLVSSLLPLFPLGTAVFPGSLLPLQIFELRYLSDQMVDALQRLQDPAMAPPPWPQPWHADDCAWLSQRWGELLPLPTAMKYRLLALREPLMRLELIGDMVSPQTPAH